MTNIDWTSAIQQKAQGSTDAAFWNAVADEIERNRAAIAELVWALKQAEQTLCSQEDDLRSLGADDIKAEIAILITRAAIAKHETSTTTKGSN